MMVYRTNGPKLLDLIYADHLAMLPANDQDTMVRSLKNSPDAWVAYHETDLVGFSGIIPPTLLSDTAYFWLYATALFAKHPIACTRVSRRLVQDALNCYPVLVGHCTARSSRWLRWLGAELFPPIDSGFIPFEIKAR